MRKKFTKQKWNETKWNWILSIVIILCNVQHFFFGVFFHSPQNLNIQMRRRHMHRDAHTHKHTHLCITFVFFPELPVNYLTMFYVFGLYSVIFACIWRRFCCRHCHRCYMPSSTMSSIILRNIQMYISCIHNNVFDLLGEFGLNFFKYLMPFAVAECVRV